MKQIVEKVYAGWYLYRKIKKVLQLLKEKWNEDKAKLEDAISDLKKRRKESKKESKAACQVVKSKFKADLKQAEKSLKEFKKSHKKEKTGL